MLPTLSGRPPPSIRHPPILSSWHSLCFSYSGVCPVDSYRSRRANKSSVLCRSLPAVQYHRKGDVVMLLLIGGVGISLTVLWFGLLHMAARKQEPSKWMKEVWIANIYVPCLVALGSLALALIGKGIIDLGRTGIHLPSAALGVATVLGSVWVFRRMMRRSRMLDRAREAARGSVLHLTPRSGGSPPVNPKQAGRRAA
jgi:hypothetical protein